MHATHRPLALLAALVVTGCYEKPDPIGVATDGDTGVDTSDSAGTMSSSNPSTTVSSTQDESGSGSSGVTVDPSVTAEDSGTTGVDPTATDTGEASDSTGEPVAPTICDQDPTTLATCVGPSKSLLNQGTLACDPTVMFTAFFEDVWTVDVAVGDCVYVTADNITDAGPTGAPAGDIAIHMRSPSGAYVWADDEVACQDAAWTGGACPEASVTADVAGTWEISVVQASGSGCTSGAPYILYVAINDEALNATQISDDVRTDC